MRTVSQLLQRKPDIVHATTPDTPVTEAMRQMAQQNIGALLVVDGERLAGIVSERDFVRKLLVHDRPLPAITVGEVMTKQVITISPKQSIEDCMALMTDKRIRHLPVVEGESLVGVLSIGDLVKDIISDQEFMIGQLTNYITDRYA